MKHMKYGFILHGTKCRHVAKVEGYILETVQDRSRLVLITNRKSHMSFRLVPKSVTLNDRERHNGRYFALFHRIRVGLRCRRKTVKL